MRLFTTLIFLVTTFFLNAQQTINASITHDGLQRDYILYVPDSYDTNNPAPLVFNFHGYSSNAGQQIFYGDFRPISDTEGFILVHPEGLEDSMGNPHFNAQWGTGVDDIGSVSYTHLTLPTICSV